MQALIEKAYGNCSRMVVMTRLFPRKNFILSAFKAENIHEPEKKVLKRVLVNDMDITDREM